MCMYVRVYIYIYIYISPPLSIPPPSHPLSLWDLSRAFMRRHSDLSRCLVLTWGQSSLSLTPLFLALSPSCLLSRPFPLYIRRPCGVSDPEQLRFFASDPLSLQVVDL